MTMRYHKTVPYAFKKFTVLRALKTGPATLKYRLRKPALPKGDKLALFTMNILPPMMTVWYECVRKSMGQNVDTVIFDCSGDLDPSEFPGATVQKFLNQYASTKSEEFLRSIARHRTRTMICDDDVFPISGDIPAILSREFAVERTASVSFKPRTWWHFDIDGKDHEPSGSYCLGIDRDIFIRENLSLDPEDGNDHPSHIGKPVRRYDTFDKANEQLLKLGYRCAIVPEKEREQCVAAYSGLSSAVMLLHHFKGPDQVMDFFLTPPKKQWSGNMLYGILCGMLAISTVQELYEHIKGHKYPLRALPEREVLERTFTRHRQYMRDSQSIDWVRNTDAKLKLFLG